MQTVILLLGIGVFAVAAYGDLRARRIPNGLAVAVAVLGLARLFLAGDPRAALYAVAAAVAVFLVAFLLFRRGWVGGGDAKLLAASTLLVGYRDLFGFLLLMSLCGSLLALAVLTASRFGGPLRHLLFATTPAALAPEAASARPTVPYGVVIAAAGVVILILQTPFPK